MKNLILSILAVLFISLLSDVNASFRECLQECTSKFSAGSQLRKSCIDACSKKHKQPMSPIAKAIAAKYGVKIKK